MTVLEMHTAVLLGLDKSASFEVAAFEPEDIDYWLNEAQLELIKRKMFGNNYRKESYDTGIKRIEDLRTIVEEATLSAPTVSTRFNNLYPVNTTGIVDYMFFVHAHVAIQDPNAPITTLKNYDVKLLTEEESGTLLSNSYNDPVLKGAYAYIESDFLNIIIDPYATIGDIELTYVKTPGVLVRTSPGPGEVTTSDLPEQVHQEIVALTVSLMLENIESPRFQSQLLTLNNKE